MNINPDNKFFLNFEQTFTESKNKCGALRNRYDIYFYRLLEHK